MKEEIKEVVVGGVKFKMQALSPTDLESLGRSFPLKGEPDVLVLEDILIRNTGVSQNLLNCMAEADVIKLFRELLQFSLVKADASGKEGQTRRLQSPDYNGVPSAKTNPLIADAQKRAEDALRRMHGTRAN